MIAALLVSLTAVSVLDVDCKGDDLFIDGVYQKACDLSLETCKQKCQDTPQCGAYVYNYQQGQGENPQWTDGCCWLKQQCSNKVQMNGKIHEVIREVTAQAKDSDCKGDDLFINGVYQKTCEITLETCKQKCQDTPQCGAYVYNYQQGQGENPQWTDGCCWLKQQCSNKVQMNGKIHEVIREVTAQVKDSDCKGDDLFIDGVYQKTCDLSLETCKQKCQDTPQCGAYVYNYQQGQGENPQWTDGCCWLKQQCSNKVQMNGKIHEVIREVADEKPKPQTPEKRKDSDYGPIQISEVIFKDKNGVIQKPSSVEVPEGNSPAGEGADNLIDNDPNTKWLEFTHAPVIFKFEKEVEISEYSFITANDAQQRDPVEWNLQVNGVTVSEVRTGDDVFPLGRFETTRWLSIEVIPTSIITFKPLITRGMPHGIVTHTLSSANHTIWDISCEGNDLVVDGHYQRGCGIQESLCSLVCSRTPSCALYTFQYQNEGPFPLHDSSCCSLKSQCTDHRIMYGNKVVLMRHSVMVVDYQQKTLKDRIAEVMRSEGITSAGDALDVLSNEFGAENVIAAAESWVLENHEQPLEEEIEEPEQPLPFFVLPKKITPRPHFELLRALQLQKRPEGQSEPQ